MISVSGHVYFIWCSQNIKLPQNERHELKEGLASLLDGFMFMWLMKSTKDFKQLRKNGFDVNSCVV